MKKILIVARDGLLREALRLACEKMKFEAVATDHSAALNAFLTQEPAAVIVCDYDEKGDKEHFPGAETFRDIKNSATVEIVLRLGFAGLDRPDYLQLPLDLKELEKKLGK